MQQIAIIGSGPAGYTAAIYAARSGYEVTLYTGIQPGGQLTITTEVDNYPGFADSIMGPDLMMAMGKQVERMGATIITQTVTSLERHQRLAPSDKWYVEDDRGPDHSKIFDAVILATRATAKWLDIPGEQELMGRGVSGCATCDGFFFRNKTVAVIGGGDTAMEEATYLAKLCAKVYLVHRRDEFRASKAMLERARATSNIEFLTPFAPVAICGEEKVTHLEVISSPPLELNHALEGSKKIAVDGVFVAIGHKPQSDLVKHLDILDDHGYVNTQFGTSYTAVPGLFACGDVADPVYRQAITSAGSGCIAAMDAASWLQKIGG
jgi:thioredoxin reductase (NADPH)